MKHFEWDENKRAANIAKHGIDLLDAVEIFTDPNRIEFSNKREGEDRFQTIGRIGDMIIVLVVYTYGGEKKRLISARRASKKERECYYNSR